MKLRNPRVPGIAVLAVSLLCLWTQTAVAQSPLATQPPTSSSLPTAGAVAPKVQPSQEGTIFFGNIKAREEYLNWFPTTKADGNYAFFGAVVRAGVTRQTGRDETTLELALPFLVGMPTKAMASSPQGASGWGATYRSSNGDQIASLFIKQGFVRFKNVGASTGSVRIGRFEFADGLETATADPTLAYLKQNRLAQRLIGTAYVTFLGRSFDGIQYTNDTPQRNLTALTVFPTRGAYDIKGADTLTDIQVAYLAATYPHPGQRDASEGRVFSIYYGDQRPGTVKADNRPVVIRSADHAGISIGTFGGDYIRSWNASAGKMDALLWAAGQMGQWGALRHGAYAYSAEIGYQFTRLPVKPWLRAGYSFASGDGNNSDGQHGTFMPLLPTSRIYARFPFFTPANLKDLFAMVILKPGARTTLRADIHHLELADSHDLWYSGTGAFENANFGYTGRPTGGNSSLATLIDISADVQLPRQTLLSLYVAYARAGSVVSSVYNGRDAEYAFVQLQRSF